MNDLHCHSAVQNSEQHLRRALRCRPDLRSAGKGLRHSFKGDKPIGAARNELLSLRPELRLVQVEVVNSPDSANEPAWIATLFEQMAMLVGYPSMICPQINATNKTQECIGEDIRSCGT
jgi:hypothetical protein